MNFSGANLRHASGVLLCAFAIALPTVAPEALEVPELTVVIANLRSGDGQIRIALWNDPETFATEDTALAEANQAARQGEVRFTFQGLDPGQNGHTYFVRQVEETAWIRTFPTGDGTHTLALARGENIEGLYFGSQEAGGPVAIEEDPASEIPTDFQLHANYPNPFNPETTIRFDVQEAEHVVLKVYNLLGQEVATLVDARFAPGSYRATFDGQGLSSGIYLYRIEMGDFHAVKTMVLLQ